MLFNTPHPPDDAVRGHTYYLRGDAMTSAPRSPRPANCEGGGGAGRGTAPPRPGGGMCDLVPSST